MFLHVLLLVLSLAPSAPATTPSTRPSSAEALALRDKVLARSGRGTWPGVSRLKFTFHVERPDGQASSVQHDWNLRTGEDAVTANGQTTTVNVFAYDASKATEAETAAFRRWTNDSYWLLMPLKLGDPGARVALAGEEEIEGAKYTVLRLTFDNVGLTPGDAYMLYVDAEGLIRRWDYMPNAERKATWTWEGYKDFNGLTLATEHRPVGDGPRIFFTDIRVEK